MIVRSLLTFVTLDRYSIVALDSLYFTKSLVEGVTRGPGFHEASARTKRAHARDRTRMENTCAQALEPVHVQDTKKRPRQTSIFCRSAVRTGRTPTRTATPHTPPCLCATCALTAVPTPPNRRQRRPLPPRPAAAAVAVGAAICRGEGGRGRRVRGDRKWRRRWRAAEGGGVQGGGAQGGGCGGGNGDGGGGEAISDGRGGGGGERWRPSVLRALRAG